MNAGRFVSSKQSKPRVNTLETLAALSLALAAVDAARAELDRYALATDTPAWGAPEAADLLDASRVALAMALAGVRRHDAA